MNKLKIFFKTFRRSLTEPAYYKDILSAKFSFSVKYLFGLLFFVSFIIGIITSVQILRLIPQAPSFVENAKSFVVKTYPSELVLTLKNKKVVSNVSEPYFIDLPPENKDVITGFDHFIAINTKGSVDDFETLSSMLVVTPDSLVASDTGGGYKVIPLSETFAKIPDGAYIDQTNLKLILEGVSPYLLKLIPNVLYVISIILITLYPLLRAFFSLVTQMIVLLPVALVLFIFAKIVRRQISYAKVYQFCMHGLTITTILSLVFGSFSFYSWGVWIAWLIFYIFIGSVILKLNPKTIDPKS